MFFNKNPKNGDSSPCDATECAEAVDSVNAALETMDKSISAKRVAKSAARKVTEIVSKVIPSGANPITSDK